LSDVLYGDVVIAALDRRDAHHAARPGAGLIT